MDPLDSTQLFFRDHFSRPPRSVLAAVSGGVDSVVMLDCLLKLRGSEGFQLAVAHLNHELRGERARKDRSFVRDRARELGLQFVSESRDVEGLARAEGLSLEEAARKVRYRFLEEAAEDLEMDWIALGHNRDDQAETLLLHLLRGAGLRGLGGMRPVSGAYIRPLLNSSRESIEKFARREGLDFRVDRTNTDLRYSRNKIRHELLPRLEEEYNPNIKKLLAQTARLMGEAREYIDGQAREGWNKAVSAREEGQVSFDFEQILELHPFLRKEALRFGLREVKGNLKGISFDHIQDVLRQMKSGEPCSQLHLPGDVIFRKTREAAFFQIGPKEEKEIQDYEYEFHPGGKLELKEAGWCLRAEVKELRSEKDRCQWPSRDPLQEVLDWDKVEGDLIVRNRRCGDSFTPLGMEGEKKLKDLFIDEKVPRRERRNIPLVCDEEGIIWVVGLRIEERCKVEEGTERIFLLKAKRLES